MSKYEERVRQLAEEMAKVRFPNIARLVKNGSIFYIDSWYPDYVEPLYPLARLSVHREAEAFKSAWLACDAREADLDNYTMDELLINGGLIPPQTQTT